MGTVITKSRSIDLNFFLRLHVHHTLTIAFEIRYEGERYMGHTTAYLAELSVVPRLQKCFEFFLIFEDIAILTVKYFRICEATLSNI